MRTYIAAQTKTINQHRHKQQAGTMGKKSKTKAKRTEGRSTSTTKTESRVAATISDHSSPYAATWIWLSTRLPCHHGAPSDWSTIPYLSTVFDNYNRCNSFQIYKKVYELMPRNDSGLQNVQILIKGLAALGAVNLHMGFAGEVSLEEALDSAFRTADIMAFLEWIIHMRQCANIDFTKEEMNLKLDHVRCNLDSRKKLVTFFADRIPCNCLDVALRSVQDINTGKCRNCDRICKDTGELQDCAGCHMVKYCSRECQREHWPKHRDICSRQHKPHKNDHPPSTTPKEAERIRQSNDGTSAASASTDEA